MYIIHGSFYSSVLPTYLSSNCTAQLLSSFFLKLKFDSAKRTVLNNGKQVAGCSCYWTDTEMQWDAWRKQKKTRDDEGADNPPELWLREVRIFVHLSEAGFVEGDGFESGENPILTKKLENHSFRDDNVTEFCASHVNVISLWPDRDWVWCLHSCASKNAKNTSVMI